MHDKTNAHPAAEPDAVKAAAERLKVHDASLSGPYKGHPEQIKRDYIHDLMTLAHAYLSLRTAGGVPVDDSELPVTEEWLRSVGFEKIATDGCYRYWERTLFIQDFTDSNNGKTRHWIRIHEPQDDWWPIDLFQQGDQDEKPDGFSPLSQIEKTTRGHVRRLFAALGITLPAPADVKGGE